MIDIDKKADELIEKFKKEELIPENATTEEIEKFKIRLIKILNGMYLNK